MLSKYLKYKRFIFIKKLLLFFSVCFLCTIILIMPHASSGGVKTGLKFCIDILIPSLFPFLVLSSLIVKTGISESIGRFISPITKSLFKLPGYAGTTILLSLIGGYPTGAIGVKELYNQKKLSEKQAEQMLLFTVGAGPAFVISAIGTQISHDKSVGLIIFISQIISSIIIGIFAGFFSNNTMNLKNTLNTPRTSFSCALVESCLEAARSMFNMCAFVVLFSALLNILNETSIANILLKFLSFLHVPSSILNCIFPIMLEVTSGCMSIIKNRAPTELIAFTLGWAGLCVHFQIFSITESIAFSKSKFILCRFLHGILSAIIVHFLFFFVSSHSSSHVIKLIYSSDKSDCYLSKGSIALIFLCVYFLCTLTPKNIILNKNNQESFRRYKIERNKKRKFKKTLKK